MGDVYSLINVSEGAYHISVIFSDTAFMSGARNISSVNCGINHDLGNDDARTSVEVVGIIHYI
jgi:hypothetical protein